MEYILRCTCDWERVYHEIIAKTVHPSFLRKGGFKTMKDWSPPIFKNGGNTHFQQLIKAQKAVVIKRVYDFAFKLLSSDKGNLKKYAIDKSVESGRNLYIRGPAGSGRGLLMACMKMLAAARNISTTPNPSDWATFKSDLLDAENYNRSGEEAKILVNERYKNVQILTLENVRGEGAGAFSQDRKYFSKFKASAALDDVISKRLAKPGSMIFSSSDFIRQFGDSMGDRLPEVLISDATSLVLMFSPIEADDLLRGLKEKLNSYWQYRLFFYDKAEKNQKDKYQERLQEEQALKTIEDSLYFESEFWHMPNFGEAAGDSLEIETQSNTALIEMFPGKWDKRVLALMSKFREEKKNESLGYKENRKRVLIAASEKSKPSERMTDKERHETGLLMSIACKPPKELNEIMVKAIELRDKMI